jgi:phosphate transport system permease protein
MAEKPGGILRPMNVKKAKNPAEKAMSLIFFICGILSVAFVLFITLFLVVSGVPAIGKIGIFKFLFGTVWASTASDPKFGILPFILTSVYGTFGAVLIAVPVGLLCAIYLSKFAGSRLAELIRSAVELLAGIPSVVYGLVGMILIVPAVRTIFHLPDGANLFSAIIVLSVMVLPNVISVSETSLLAVPHEYEEASLALGATYTETVFKVSVPAAKSGIASAVVLGVGRAIGEAMAVMMVSGNVANMPGLFKSVRFLTTAVASEMSYSSGLQRQALFSIALVLFIFIMIITLLLNFVFKKEKK